MRSSPADQIRAILNGGTLGFPPAVDNKTNNGNFQAAINAHTVADVPILLGTNADEGTNIFGNDTRSQALARAAYPHDATEKELKSRIITDYLYTCTTSAIANVLSDTDYKVWQYYFNASFPNTQPFLGAGAWHTSEISLVFGTYPRNYMTTPQQIELSKFMQHSWASFAKDPERGPGWIMIGSGKEDLQVIGANGTSWGQSSNKESVEDMQMCLDNLVPSQSRVPF
ncbi:Carboxylesterase, type B [Penicillium expansum]|uniref:Carboxylesterase, type B n=1 Tax=Penicillium expansum TaxID=27334 RepID=A0A0A2J269_PENEN|nr:Carboxylesterase, type B [Penicillium expansum]KGO48753.1 Carboxylesterase, type B [Penicillium expansum]KGO52951.1 Carboxylesterase, type B [Penicillium expansum]KGO53732.1 Carboxylesterase, type B [Penicillium expansum]